MKIVFGIVIAVVVIFAVVLVVGLVLPRDHRAASRITLHKPPEEVWPVVRDPASLVGVWSSLKSANRLPEQSGKEIWEENSGGFVMKLIVEESAPPSRLVMKIDAPPNASFGGVWTYEIAPASGGSTVTVTEDGYVNNPFFRTMMKLMGVHKTADEYLTALGKKLGEPVVVEHVE